jgi:hypothetical protein
MWPSAPGLDRLCTKDYNLGTPNKETSKDYVVSLSRRPTLCSVVVCSLCAIMDVLNPYL